VTPSLRLALCTVSVLALAQGAAAQDLREMAQDMFAPLPSTLPALNDNVITDEKVDLGKALFFDPRMSASGVFSCNSCHNLATGGDDNMETSIGHAWQKGPRNSPTVLNAVFNEAQFWDGRAADLAEQAKGLVQAGVEMANTPDNVVATLNSMPQYVEWFEESFPDEASPVSFDNFAKAIEAYEATLITPAPFDAWLNGDDGAMTEEQVAGLELPDSAGVQPPDSPRRFDVAVNVNRLAEVESLFRAPAERVHDVVCIFGAESGEHDTATVGFAVPVGV